MFVTSQSVRASTAHVCTDWEREIGPNARWLLAWLQAQHEWNVVLKELRDAGRRLRRKGLPWRELAAHELERLAGDKVRAGKDYARMARRLERVLPPRLRPLVALGVIDERGAVTVEIDGTRTIGVEHIARLQAVCLATLRGEKMPSRDRKFRDARLAAMDPVSVTIPVPLDLGADARELVDVAISPTALGAGSLAVGPSQAGSLPVGRLVVAGDAARVVPRFTFAKKVL